MTIQYVNTGSSPNAGNGDSLRVAFNKINYNFGEIVDQLSTIEVGTTSTLIAGTYTFALSNTGEVTLNGAPFTSGGVSTGPIWELTSGTSVISLDKSGTLNTPLLLPKAFTAVLDEAHRTVGAGSYTGPAWAFNLAWQCNQNGEVELLSDNGPLPSLVAGYADGQTFEFTEADHGIPDYTLTIVLSNVVYPGGAGWTANLNFSQPPVYPSTIKSSGAIKLSANDNNFVLGTNGVLTFPDGATIGYSEITAAPGSRLYLYGGDSQEDYGNDVRIYGGNAGTASTSTVYDGGRVRIYAGRGVNGGQSGHIRLRTFDNNNSYDLQLDSDGTIYFPSGAGFVKGESGQLKTNDGTTLSLDFRDQSGRGFYTNGDGYTLRSNGTYNWIFGTDGKLTAPGHIVPNANLAYDLGSTSSQWRSIYVGTGTIYIGGVALGVNQDNYVTVDGNPIITINTAGNLTIQGDVNIGTVTVSDTAPTATTGTQWFNTVDGRTYVAYNGLWVDANPTQIPSPSTYLDGLTIDNTTISPSTVGENVIVETNGSSWTFGADGILTLPGGNTRIGNIFGTDGIVGSSGTAVAVFAQGSGGLAALQWIDNTENVGSSGTQVAAVIVNSPIALTTGTVQIVTGVATGPSVGNIWEFGSTGTLTLPQGSTIGETTSTTVITPPGAGAGQSLVIRPTAGQIYISTDHPTGFVLGESISISVSTAFGDSTGTLDYTFTGATAQQLGYATSGTLTFSSQSTQTVTWTVPAQSSMTTFTFDLTGGTGFNNPGPGIYPESLPEVTVTLDGSAVSENNHVHLVAGNPTTTDIYLGDDNQYVKIEKNNGDVVIGTTNFSGSPTLYSSWIFGTDGKLTIPDDIQDANGSVVRVATTSTAPTRVDGQLWYNSEEGRTYIKYNGAWVDASPTQIPSPSTYLDEIQVDGSEFIINGYSLTVDETGTLLVDGGQVTGGGGQTNQITSGSYSVSIVDTGVVTMATSRGTLEFGALPEPGGVSHFHIMKSSSSTAVDLYFGDDYNYVLQRGNSMSELAGHTNDYGVEIGTRDLSTGTSQQYVWRFGTDGDLTLPGQLLFPEGTTFYNNGISISSGTQYGTSVQGNTAGINQYWFADGTMPTRKWAAVRVNSPENASTGSVVVSTGPFNSRNNWIFAHDGSTVLPENTLKGYCFTTTNTVFNYLPQSAQFMYTDNPILQSIATIGGAWYIKGPGLVGWKQITGIQDNGGVALIVRIGSGNTPLPDGSEFNSGGHNPTSPDLVYTISQYLEFDLQVADKTWNFKEDGVLTLPAASPVIKGGGTGTDVTVIATTGTNTATWVFGASGAITFPDDTIQTTAFTGTVAYSNITGAPASVNKTSGSWTLAPGANTVSITVAPGNNYQMWVNGNIPNGIVEWNATVNVSNTNVPAIGSQYGWYYAAGNALVLTSMPNQIVGTAGVISTATVATTSSNVFRFGITNNSTSSQVINWGYTTL
jgi:hypothetical protein